MAGDLVLASGRVIPAAELRWSFGPSGGPGGQHANTANTRAELVFEIETSPTLDDDTRERLARRLGPRVRVVVDETRSQQRNRALAEERLVERLDAALVRRKRRRPTRPGRRANERRLRAKKERAQRKADRRRPPID